MPRGKYPNCYLRNERPGESIEQIFRDLNDYTLEYFREELIFHSKIDVVVVLPPLQFRGTFVKGLLYSQSVDYICELYPWIGDLFHLVANSQWCSFPQSLRADAYFSCYDNPLRNAWFRAEYPTRGEKILIGMQDADRTNENLMSPRRSIKKEYDVICVSRMQSLKNLPVVAEALKIYRKKYGIVRMLYIPGANFDRNLKGLSEHERSVWRQVERTLVHVSDYIDIIPRAEYRTELPKYYSMAKICVLGSLVEGKNRSIYEAAMCDTAVVWFDGFNRYIRGGQNPLAEGAGIAAPCFGAESLADTFHLALSNLGEFNPRLSVLSVSGRKQFLQRLLSSFPHYAATVPFYADGDAITNTWLDSATQYNYAMSLNDFTYDRECSYSWAQGLKQIDKLFKLYFDRFESDHNALTPIQIHHNEASSSNDAIRKQPSEYTNAGWDGEAPLIVVGVDGARLVEIAKIIVQTGVFMREGLQGSHVSLQNDSLSYEDEDFDKLNRDFLNRHIMSYNDWRTNAIRLLKKRCELSVPWGWACESNCSLISQYIGLLKNAKVVYCKVSVKCVLERITAEHSSMGKAHLVDLLTERIAALEQHMPSDALVIPEDVSNPEIMKRLDQFFVSLS